MFSELNSWMIQNLWQATLDTIIMVALSGVISIVVGILLGVALYITHPDRFLAKPILHRVLGLIVNIGRSIPFIILMLAIVPFTRLIMGTSIGLGAAVVPLTVAAIPFVARLIEGALNEVSPGLIETAQSMGATPMQIIWKVLLPEAKSGIITSTTITLITLISYSAMAGAVGAGGLGAIGINYGYNRYDTTIMVITVVITVVLVQIIQSLGDYLVKRTRH